MWAQPPWTLEAWEWIIRQELDLNPKPPTWLHLPAMMRVVSVPRSCSNDSIGAPDLQLSVLPVD